MCIIRVTYCVHTDSGICLGKSFCCSSCLARGALVRNWWSQCRCYSRWSIYHTWCCWRSQSMCMMLLLFKAYDCFVLWSCFLFSFRVEFPLFCACWLVAVCYVSDLKYHNYSMLFSYRHVWKLFEVSYRADVVAATCVGAGDAILDGRCFQLCVIDEATQVSCNSTAPFIATYPRLTSNFIRSCAVF